MIRRFAFAALILGAVACGDDGDDNKNNGTPDASLTPEAGAPDAYVPTPDKVINVGTACSAAADCDGASPRCLTNLSLVIFNIAYPGGFCTASCQQDVECGGTGGVCPLGPLLASGGLPTTIPVGDISSCQKECTTDADCRTDEGYRCVTLIQALPATVSGILSSAAADAGAAAGGLNRTFCFPPAPAVPEAGMPEGGSPEAGTPDGGTDDASTDDASTDDASTDDASTPDASE